MPATSPYDALILQEAQRNGIDPNRFRRQLILESSLNPTALSPGGDQGIAQLSPATAQTLGVTNPNDPNQAIPAAARYMGQLKQRFGGNEDLAAAAYNYGPANVVKTLNNQAQLPAAVNNYVTAIRTGAPTLNANGQPDLPQTAPPAPGTNAQDVDLASVFTNKLKQLQAQQALQGVQALSPAGGASAPSLGFGLGPINPAVPALQQIAQAFKGTGF